MPEGIQYFRLSCLTPVHIGSGFEYIGGIDIVTRNNKSWLLDTGRVLEALHSQGQLPRGADDLKSRIKNLFERAQPEHYALASGSAAVTDVTRVRAFIRSGDGRPMIPGSSLKGALRTLMFAARVRTAGSGSDFSHQLRDAAGRSQQRSRFAASQVENAVFRNNTRRHRGDAKADLLRLCSISDAAFSDGSTTIVLSAAVGTDRETFMAAETLAPQSATAVAIRMGDSYLEREMFTQKLPPLSQIAQWSRTHAQLLLDGDLQYFGQHTSRRDCSAVITRLEEFARQIADSTTDTIFLRLGWGTGWRTMTGDLLPDGLERKRLLPKSNALGPKTRKVIVAGGDKAAPAVDVLGWISLSPISAQAAHELASKAVPPVRAKPVEPLETAVAPQGEPSTDPFIQGLNALRTSDWGRLPALYQQAQQSEGDARKQALAERITTIWGREKKRMAEARQKFPGLAAYWR